MSKTDRFALTATLLVLAVLAWSGTYTPAMAQQRRATPTPTVTATATGTPTPTPTTAALAPPPPPAQLLLPAPSVKNQLVGDVVSQAGVPLSANYPTLFGDRIALGMANLRDVTAGPNPGDGIESVEFSILNMDGDVLHYRRTGPNDRFCAFGGAGDDCAIFDLAANGYRWPDGGAAVSGRYTLVAFARGDAPDHKGAWTLSFEVRLSRDDVQASDGEARIVNVSRVGPRTFDVTVATLGFVPFARSTHLIFHAANVRDVDVTPRAPGVFLVYPEHDQMDRPGAYGSSTVRVTVGSGPYAGLASLCVAVVHPDNTVLPGRGDCVRLPR